MSEINRHTRLQKLKGSDFEMADGEPDIRDWEVRNNEGIRIGDVEELIFDIQSRKVRYLVIDLEKNEFKLPSRHVLVPIGIAELHETDDSVILTGITPTQLETLPEYDEERFDTEHETSVRNVFGGLGSSALSGGSSNDTDFYNHEHFNDQNLYRKRTRRVTTTPDATLASEKYQDEQREADNGLRLRSRTGNDPLNPPIEPRQEL